MARNVVEIGRGNDICAATALETCAWLETLKKSKPQVLADSRTRLEQIRSSLRKNKQLFGDVQSLRASIDDLYDAVQSDIKDSIKFILITLLGEATVAENIWSATRDLALSRAVGNDVVSFGADASLIVRSSAKNGAPATVRKLGALTLTESLALLGAEKISATWVKPTRDKIDIILKNSGLMAKEAVLKQTEEAVSVGIVGGIVYGGLERDLVRTSQYAKTMGATCGK